MATAAEITKTDRECLEPRSSDYLRGMMAMARRAAETHERSFRPYMAELCIKRADACAVLLAERGEA